MFEDNIFIFIIVLIAIVIVAYLVVNRSDPSIIETTENESDGWEEFQAKSQNGVPPPPPPPIAQRTAYQRPVTQGTPFQEQIARRAYSDYNQNPDDNVLSNMDEY